MDASENILASADEVCHGLSANRMMLQRRMGIPGSCSAEEIRRSINACPKTATSIEARVQ